MWNISLQQSRPAQNISSIILISLLLCSSVSAKERRIDPRVQQAVIDGERYCAEDLRRNRANYQGHVFCPLFTATIDVDPGTFVYGRKSGMDGTWEAKETYKRGDKVLVFPFGNKGFDGRYFWIARYDDEQISTYNLFRIEAKYLKPVTN